MVFSSLEFIYLFLPPVLLVFLVLRHLQWENGIVWWLILASLGFYAWWSPVHLILMMGSVGLNYGLHKLILKNGSKVILGIGIAANLATLAYFKYADFLIENFNVVAGTQVPMIHVILPLAISFFTFQQISFLYDTWKHEVTDCTFSKYCLFVVFFPQLIAGPIVLQRQTIPQFTLAVFQKRLFVNLSIGSTLFIVGLFKKIVLADGIAPIANSVFALADSGEPVPMAAAWMGTIAYTFQIYFDFSGYCDMALGLARMFGIRLPINFNSPYKALSIVDFWGRWHMTLSAFLRDFLYIPLGGNRKGPVRRYINLGATMLLGGLWHGASWNFVLWGLLHGCYLSVNHGWKSLSFGSPGFQPLFPPIVTRTASRVLTLLAVMIAWVLFRAETFVGAKAVLTGMSGMTMWYDRELWNPITEGSTQYWWQVLALTFLVINAPNSIEIVRRYKPVINGWSTLKRAGGWSDYLLSAIAWRPSRAWAGALAVTGLIAVIQLYRLDDMTEFIYFNF